MDKVGAMVRFLIASHGYLADGMKSTLEIIVGKEIADRVFTVNAFVDGGSENVRADAEAYIKGMAPEDQLVIFSDMMHGSVNQCLLPFIDDERIFLITGMNFPLICELVARYSYMNDPEVCAADLKSAAEKAGKEIIFVNDFMKRASTEEKEEDFFE